MIHGRAVFVFSSDQSKKNVGAGRGRGLGRGRGRGRVRGRGGASTRGRGAFGAHPVETPGNYSLQVFNFIFFVHNIKWAEMYTDPDSHVLKLIHEKQCLFNHNLYWFLCLLEYC